MNGCHRVLCVASLVVGLVLVVGFPNPVRGQAQAESLSASFRKAAERIDPAVVSVRPLNGGFRVHPGAIGPIRPFEAVPRLPLAAGDSEQTGSGFVIDGERGYILTNDHILAGASQATVVLKDGRERATTQVRRDPSFDLAVLAIDPAGLNLVSATWGDPSALRPGDWVLSIGRADGLAPTLSSGIFSARRRGVSSFAPAEEWLETDAAVNSLNSGGPLVNLNGEVVGMTTAVVGRRGPIAGMGFAFPADRARRIAGDLIAYGMVRRAFLGVQIEPTVPSVLDGTRGSGSVVIASVTPGTPAAEAGLRPGDAVVSLGGRSVVGVAMIQEMIENAAIGEDLTLGIERSGQRQEITVRPRARPAAAAPPGFVGARPLSEARREVYRGPRSRVIPRDASPRPAPANPSAGEETPLSLEPIPKPGPPQNNPSLEPPANAPQENPK